MFLKSIIQQEIVESIGGFIGLSYKTYAKTPLIFLAFSQLSS